MGSSGIRHRTLVGALLAPVLLLAACGSGNDNGSVADPPISSSPSSSSPTKPPHRESPEHFIRRFAAVEKRMENTGQVREYLMLTRPCAGCQDLARQIEGYYRAGGYVHWDGWSIRSIRPYRSDKRQASYQVSVVSAPTRYRESDDGPIEHLRGGPATEIVSIRRSSGSWVVTGRAKLAA